MSNEDKWGPGVDTSKWHDCGSVTIGKHDYPLVLGEHPHSRSGSNSLYVDMRKNKDDVVTDDTVVGFSGNRTVFEVIVSTNNYVKRSGLSGNDVRAGGSYIIKADGIQIWEAFVRDVQRGLLEAHRIIDVLSEHSSNWLVKSDRDNLAGRKIFYRELPCIITRLSVARGEVTIQRADGSVFPPPVYADDDEDDEHETSICTSVTDSNIWWFRK